MFHRDKITKLSTRPVFFRRVKRAIRRAKKSGKPLALLYLDIDNFKLLNNVFGHDIGDKLLRSVGCLLKNYVSSGDFLARLGGDEFVLLITTISKQDEAAKLAKKILLQLEGEAFEIDQERIFVNASIGVSVFPKSGNASAELIRHAESAMYAAKSKGSNSYKLYSPNLDFGSSRLISILKGFRDAILCNELFILYQPILDIQKNKCVAVEALVRWHHPILGIISPEEFLLAAEDMGIMPKISLWVIKQVYSDFPVLNKAGLDFVTINVNADDLSNKKTITEVKALTKAHKIDIDKIVFEINESSFVRDPKKMIRRLKQLFSSKIKLAIDDYGSGYSSLGYLKDLPITILKMDKAFVCHVPKDKKDCTILKSTISLAHDLGFKVVAEGIEKPAQAKYLKSIKCDYVQGFYYSKPLTLDAFIEFATKR